MVAKQGDCRSDEQDGICSLQGLIDECLVIVKERTKGDRAKSFDTNYNLHRLAIKKAEEDIRFQILTKKTSNNQSSSKPRHRAIYCSREKFNYSSHQDRYLVSLFFHGGGYFDSGPCYWNNLELLKILDWEGFGLKSLSIPIEELISLKYLGLRNNYLQELPRKLGQLKRLEVLDIEQNFLVEVPNVLQKMGSLHHLYMTDIICRKPLKIDALKNLETLTNISINYLKYKVSGLKMMACLRKLGIEEVDGKSDVRKLFASLAKLKNLNHLILRGFRFRRMPELSKLPQGLKHLKLDGLLTRLPCRDNFSSSIELLSLVNSYLDEDPMLVLKNLYNLRHLKLQNAYSGKQMVISWPGFGRLQSLCIAQLWHLRDVQVEKRAMCLLEKLEIRSCPYLKTLPEEIGSMWYLKELKMVTTNTLQW